MPKQKAQARSSRVAVDPSSAFSPSPFFGSASSAFSVLADPPDIQSISNSKVSVVFKGLLKRDETTKVKALGDLVSILSKSGKDASVTEDAVLDAWASIYPRLSIDSSRRVRQLSHNVVGAVTASAGRKIASRMPSLIGPWIMGTYDSDRAVSAAAVSALRCAFSSPEKVQALRKVYHAVLLGSCKTIFEDETPQTLSDERYVSKEEATEKYSRVLSTCIGLFSSLIANRSVVNGAYDEEYRSILSSKDLWRLATAPDAASRRSVHTLASTCLAMPKIASMIDLDRMSTFYLDKGLKSDQKSSSQDYLDALLALTMFKKSIWTENWKSKETQCACLSKFFRKGSQISRLQFWTDLVKLIGTIPPETLPANCADAEEFLKAFLDGATRKDEPRSHFPTSIGAYFEVVQIAAHQFEEKDREKLLESSVLPLVLNFGSPSSETNCAISPRDLIYLVRNIVKIDGMSNVLNANWSEFSATLISSIRASQTGDKKEKDHPVLNQIDLWVHVTASLAEDVNFARQIDSDPVIFPVVLEMCSIGEGDRKSVAHLIASFCLKCKAVVKGGTNIISLLEKFAIDELPGLFLTDFHILASKILSALQEYPFAPAATQRSLEVVLDDSRPDNQLPALIELLKLSKDLGPGNSVSTNTRFRHFLEHQVKSALHGNSSWDALIGLVSHLDLEFAQAMVLVPVVVAMTSEELIPYALYGFASLINNHSSLINRYLKHPECVRTISHLLVLTESPVEKVAVLAEEAVTLFLNHAFKSEPMTVGVALVSALSRASNDSPSVETLIMECKSLAIASENLHLVLPAVVEWEEKLSSLFNTRVPASLALTSPLGGAVHWIEGRNDRNSPKVADLEFDVDGFSVPLRMAFFVSELFKQFGMDRLSTDTTNKFLYLLALTTTLANEGLSLIYSNQLWRAVTPESIEKVSSLIADFKTLLLSPFKHTTNGSASNEAQTSLFEELLEKSSGRSAASYYHAQAYALLASDAQYQQDSIHKEQLLVKMSTLRKSTDLFSTVSFLTVHGELLMNDPKYKHWYNELLSGLTGLNVVKRQDECLRSLIILNAILRASNADLLDGTPPQRYLMFVKHVSRWLSDESGSIETRTELCVVLYKILRKLQGAYGDYWGELVLSSTKAWLSNVPDDILPESPKLAFIHETLRLYDMLKSMAADDNCNDDLIEELDFINEDACSSLLDLLLLRRSVSEELNSPLRTLDQKLVRVVQNHHKENIPMQPLYRLVLSRCETIQMAATELLHNRIPKEQMEKSVDHVLDKTKYSLPPELLSLLLNPPDMRTFTNDQALPYSCRGYILSWLLIFDHFDKTSYRLRCMYADEIRDGGYLPGLLDFTFAYLGHAKGKAVEASKYRVAEYDLDATNWDRSRVEWLLIHLYYLSLFYVPSAVRSWWSDSKLRPAVASWTAKYISPVLITKTLQFVADWNDGPGKLSQGDGEQLVLKVNPRSGDLTASYPLDEDHSLSICLTLPPEYPFQQPVVGSQHGSAMIDQKHQQAWIHTMKALIVFANNSIVDGLLVWRRNVVGYLEGVPECSICYSVVGEDGKVRQTKCGTCRNPFHFLCLNKWFKSSRDRTCPMCRTTMSGYK